MGKSTAPSNWNAREEQQEDRNAKRHNTSFGIKGTWMCSQRFEEEPTTSGISHKVFLLINVLSLLTVVKLVYEACQEAWGVQRREG